MRGEISAKLTYAASAWCGVLIVLAGLSSLRGSPVAAPAPTSRTSQPDGKIPARPSESYGKLPLVFEANRGQTAREVKFLARGNRYTLYLGATEAVFRLQSGDQTARRAGKPVVLRLRLIGASPRSPVSGLDELPGKINHLTGDNPRRWRANIPTYSKVKYEAIYPGIDLLFHGNRDQLEYDFLVGPGADTGLIRLSYQGERGAKDRNFTSLRIDGQGDLLLSGPDGEIRQRKPVIYQEVDGIRREVAGGYVLKGRREAGFWVEAYDRTRPLVIDPVLVYSTYLGGRADEQGYAVALDAAGNAYVTGITLSADFPTAGRAQTLRGAQDVFVAKLNPAGTALIYSTYLGGDGRDHSNAIAVDALGQAYITGFTDSTNFPISRALQPARRGSLDAFVAKLDSSGSGLAYSTHLGGSGDDFGGGIAIDRAGNAYLAGVTTSIDFPLANPLDASLGGPADAFIAKLNSEGSALSYSTYLGGSEADGAGSIATDSAGSAYVIGTTTSMDFPTASPFQPASGGISDAFAAKLNPAGTALLYSTYLGGSGIDRGFRLALDPSGSVFLVGDTGSTDFPTVRPLQATNGGGIDAFIAKLDLAGAVMIFSTYLGAGGIDAATDIDLDAAGNAYVTGVTTSTNFPTAAALQSSRGDSSFDAFVSKLDRMGAALIYSTHLGGSGNDIGFAIAVDSAGNAFVAGETGSTNLPRTGGFQPARGGGDSDAFIMKLAPQAAAPQATLYFPRLAATGDQVQDAENMGIAVANLSGGSGALSISAFDLSGARMTEAGLVNPAARILNPGQQLPIVDVELFGSGLAARQRDGWFKVESTARQTVGFFMMFDPKLAILDGADVGSSLRTTFVFPEIEEEGFTQIHVANPQPVSVELTFELTRFDGTLRIPAVRRTVSANGALAQSFNQLFPGLVPFESDYLRVTASLGVVPFERLGKSGQYIYALNGQDATGGATTLYSPQYVVGGNIYRSTLSIVNLDSVPGTVTFEFIGDTGTSIGVKPTLSIPARGKIYISDQAFFINAGNSLTQGYVKVTSSGVRLAGSVVFGDVARSRFSSALPLVSNLLGSAVYAHLASNAIFFMGIAIVNPTTSSANVTIEVYDADGLLLVRKVETIPAGRRQSRLLTEYFPSLLGQNRGSGYIKITADRGMATFALFGAKDLSSLSAIPPQIVP